MKNIFKGLMIGLLVAFTGPISAPLIIAIYLLVKINRNLEARNAPPVGSLGAPLIDTHTLPRGGQG